MIRKKVFDGVLWDVTLEHHNVRHTDGGMHRVDFEMEAWNDLLDEEEVIRINGVCYVDDDGNAVMKDGPEIMFISFVDYKKCYPITNFPENILAWIFEEIAIDPYEFFWKID